MIELLSFVLSGPTEYFGTLLLMIWVSACIGVVLNQAGSMVTSVITTLEIHKANRLDKKAERE